MKNVYFVGKNAIIKVIKTRYITIKNILCCGHLFKCTVFNLGIFQKPHSYFLKGFWTRPGGRETEAGDKKHAVGTYLT